MVDQYLQRAELLLQTNRTQEAEAELRKALAIDPQNAPALAFLALVCLNDKTRLQEARDYAEQAISHEPDNPFYFYVAGRTYLYSDQYAKARETAHTGLQLDPSASYLYTLLTQIAYAESKWEEMLYSADQGLQLDPEDSNLTNLRAIALVKLNRSAEAGKTIDFALYNDPENPMSHSNKGWVAIEQGRYDDAIGNFREALRLDPNLDYAREGLKEGIKAKNILYRGILRYFLWMNKLTQQNQWIVIIGLYIGYRLLRGVAQAMPELRPLIYPFLAAYIIFAFSTWIATPLSNLFLRLHPLGKHALSADEIKASNWVGAMLLVCLISFGIYLPTQSDDIATFGLLSLGMTIPVAGVFTVPPGSKTRSYLVVYAAILAASAVLGLYLPGADMLLIVYVLGIFFYGWVANYLISKTNRRFNS